MNASMYDIALRQKLRFESSKGQLSLEMLWDVPLRSRNGFDLDAVAQAANREVKAVSEESFVRTRRSPKQSVAELRLDIVKHVIEVKLAEEEKAEQRADRAKRREKLMDALERKQDAALEGMDEDAIKKELEALSD